VGRCAEEALQHQLDRSWATLPVERGKQGLCKRILRVFGQPNRSSLGTVVTRLGAVLIAAALIILAVGLVRSGRQG